MELGRADFRQDSNSTDPSLPLPSVRTTIGRHFKLVFFALLVVALVEGVHNLGVVTDRIGHLTGRFLFVLLHVFAAAAFTFLLVPFQIILALAWHRIRRVQFVQHAVIVGGGVGLGVSAYVFFAVRIERAVNYVMRRLFADVEYELSPTPRSLWQVVALLLVPSIICCLCVRRTQKSAHKRIARGEFAAPRWIGALAIFIGAVLTWWNASFWINLYRPLHLLLLAVCVALLQVGAVVSRVRLTPLPAILLIGILSVPGLHWVMSEYRSLEVLVFGNTTSVREQVRVLRGMSDFDGDGSARWFGGDDPDDSDPERWFGRIEIPNNGVDDNGLGGDVGLFDLQDRAAFEPTLSEPVGQVILISIDALRWDAVHFLNSEASATPALDALSQRSLRFARAYSQASYTRYSFGSMWHSCIPDLLDKAGAVDQSLPGLLQNRGIRTAAVVPALFERLGFQGLGFDEFYVAADDAVLPRTSDRITDRALELLGDNPAGFFWVHYFDAHSPYIGSTDSTDQSRYQQEVVAIDRAIGRLIEGLGEPPSGGRAILLMSDHGDEFGEHGGAHHGLTLYEEVVHIPLLVHTEGLEAADRKAPVRLIDVAPTILDLFHTAPPSPFRGRSLLPHPNRSRSADHRVVSMSETGVRMFIDATGRWKLIWKIGDDCVEVFDLSSDPGEQHNLVDEAPDRLRWLIRQLEAWMAEEFARRSE